MRKVLMLIAALTGCISMSAQKRYFLQGNSSLAGWSTGNDLCSAEFTQTTLGVYVLTTKLYKTGGSNDGFKITDGFSWGNFRAPSAGLKLNEVGSSEVQEGGDDNKWDITEEGIYTLTLDVLSNPHTLTCERVEPETIPQGADGVYELSTTEDFVRFAEYVSHLVIPANSSARLMADIDISDAKYQNVAIGMSQKVAWSGTFDGQGHKITINLSDTRDRTGLFAYCYHPVIKNLWIDGTITMTKRNCAGGLGGRCDGDGTRIDGILSTVTIIDNQSGDGTLGGLFANMENNDVLVSNCAFFGAFKAPNRYDNGGLVGWAGGGAGITFENCLVAPAEVNWDGGATIGRNKPNVKNCYAVNMPANGFPYQNDATVEVPSAELMASGELAYILNKQESGAAHWYQVLGTDAKPSPIGTAKVYANGEFYCDGVTAKSENYVLSNINKRIVDDHVFGADGMCTGCHAVGQEPTLSGTSYRIANIGNLVWFAAHVNGGATTANAVMTADIAQGDAKYVPIGCASNVYQGTFDGKNHSLTLCIDSDEDFQGAFGVITDGVEIKNLIVKGSVKGASYVGGIAGGTRGGSGNAQKTKIVNCGNEADITATGANGAGIIGVNMNGSASFHLANIYNTGTVHSGREGGAISGWSGGGWSTIVNALNIGEVYNGDKKSADFIRHGGTNISNCYYLESCGTDAQNQVKALTTAQMESGEAAYKLGMYFGQIIGQDKMPVLGGVPVEYVGAAGYSTMYTTEDCWLSGDVTAYIAKAVGNSLKITKIEEIPANTAVILKGGYYNKAWISCDALEEGVNDLKGSTDYIEADGTQFVLADVDGVIGFYRAEAGTTIAAGKAYLELPDAEAKALFFGEGATAIQGVSAAQADAAIYNLAGQRVSNVGKGLYIINGKKVLK